MGKVSETVAGTGVILKFVSSLIVFGFLVYSLYFNGHYELTIFKGIIAFLPLLMFTYVTSMIPFGTTFAPILFEWWWHDITFWNFSMEAWVVTGISMVANVLIVAGVGISQKQEY